MATALFSFKREKDGGVDLAHLFFGKDEKHARTKLEAHAEVCPKFGPAYKADETVEIPVDVDELPEGDEQQIAAWLDEVLLGEPFDEDEEGEEEEDEEDEEEDEG